MKTKYSLLTVVALLMLCLFSSTASATDMYEAQYETYKYKYSSVDNKRYVKYDVAKFVYNEIMSANDDEEFIIVDWYSAKPKSKDECESVSDLNYLFAYNRFCKDVSPGDASFIMSFFVSKRIEHDLLLEKGSITQERHKKLNRSLEFFCLTLSTRASIYKRTWDPEDSSNAYPEMGSVQKYFLVKGKYFDSENFNLSLADPF